MQVLEKLEILQRDYDKLKLQVSKVAPQCDDNRVVAEGKVRQQVQQAYEEMLRKKESEYKKILEEVDQIMAQ